jgi:anti-sigma regulatory factor (Ser/Thr protein kinase)
VRRDLRRALGAAGVDDGVVDELLSAVSEAVNNAVEHAQSPSRDEIAVRVTTGPARVRVDVRDFGRWRERPPAMDRGRGSTLMAAFASVEGAAGDDGTTVSLVRELAPSG